MARMKAAEATVCVLEKEGITHAFGVPGAAINPLYAALRPRNSISHTLAHHLEGAAHMAEGYTRAAAGNPGVRICTFGPAGTDMITALYSALGVRAADPNGEIVALPGDYDSQFMIEELAVGAQFNLPYIHVVANNAYLGVIRQPQRGFKMDYCVQLSFENIDAPEIGAYGVDDVAVAHGQGQRLPGDAPGRTRARLPAGARLGRRTLGAGRGRGNPRTRIQDLDGNGNRRHHRIRGPCSDRPGRADRHRALGLAGFGGRAMPKFCANLTMIYNEHPFLERFKAARRDGFAGVEHMFPYAFPKQQVAAALHESGLAQVLRNLPASDWQRGDRGIACQPGRIKEFRKRVGLTAEYATALGCPQLNCRVGIPDAGADPARVRATVLENLANAAAELKKSRIRLLIEPVNDKDIPGFWLTHAEQAIAVIREVNSDNLFLQYDFYHQSRMDGELAATHLRFKDRIAHVQIADNPGRHEPGSGEINYPHLFGVL
ncbi:MAG: TIM barrel protein, partial [Acetobacteraceae bacterium]